MWNRYLPRLQFPSRWSTQDGQEETTRWRVPEWEMSTTCWHHCWPAGALFKVYISRAILPASEWSSHGITSIFHCGQHLYRGVWTEGTCIHVESSQTVEKIRWRHFLRDEHRVADTSSLEHLNSLQETIHFIMKEENERRIPFLDTLVQRQLDGSMSLAVAIQEANPHRQIPTFCFPPPSPCQTRCLFDRAVTIAHGEAISERQHLRKYWPLLATLQHLSVMPSAPKTDSW